MGSPIFHTFGSCCLQNVPDEDQSLPIAQPTKKDYSMVDSFYFICISDWWIESLSFFISLSLFPHQTNEIICDRNWVKIWLGSLTQRSIVSGFASRLTIAGKMERLKLQERLGDWKWDLHFLCGSERMHQREAKHEMNLSYRDNPTTVHVANGTSITLIDEHRVKMMKPKSDGWSDHRSWLLQSALFNNAWCN